MKLAQGLSTRTLDLVVAGVGATEVQGPGGGPVLAVGHDGGNATGTMRVFRADSGVKVVWTSLSVPARKHETCMVFAFTPPESPLPHFTLDCSDRPDGHAFHLDLCPRVELATHREYMDEVFEPLSSAYAEGSAVSGLSATGTTRRQYAMMSPWMLVHLADEPAFRAVEPTVRAYAEHWLALLRDGLSAEVTATLAGVDLAARDDAFRANLFSPSIDPVWGRVTGMLGEQAAATIRGELERGAR